MANFHGLVVLFLALLTTVAAGFQFKVGGPKGWAVPDPTAMAYNQWAEMNRFQIGDSLLFVYPRDKDSVLQVSKDDYDKCDTSSPIKSFDDGNSVFTFDQSGPFFFTSGVKENCLKKESLWIVVMGDRSNDSSALNAPNSAPSPQPSSSPPPPPPPSSSIVITPPSSAPVEGESTSSPPPPNGASFKVVSVMSSIGAFLGSLLFVL